LFVVLQKSSQAQFVDSRERWPYLILFLGLLLTAWGSAYCHRYTRTYDLAVVGSFYVVAKLLETEDRAVFSPGHVVSGHSLKHLAAGGAGFWIIRMLPKREPIVPLRNVDAGEF
jgi:hypothetical protein